MLQARCENMSATTIEVTEISTIKISSGVETERKDLNAWDQLETIGAEISELETVTEFHVHPH